MIPVLRGCFGFAVALSLSSLTTGLASNLHCGDPLPSTAAHGTFIRIPLDDPCTTIEQISYTLAVGSIGSTPLFAAETLSDGACGWSIATVTSGKIASLVHVPLELWGSPIARAPDGSFWAVVGTHYLHVLPNGDRTFADASDGFAAASVGIDSAGRVIGVEKSAEQPIPKSVRLLVLQSRTSVSLAAGYPADLIRGLDGALYLTIESATGCSSYKIADGVPIASPQCLGTPAVTPPSSMWLPWLVGVQHVAADGTTTQVSIPAAPCHEISNTAVLKTRAIVPEADGGAWFNYRGLWHVDARGELSSIAFPAGFFPTTMIGTTDEALWLVGGAGGVQSAAMYEFRPQH